VHIRLTIEQSDWVILVIGLNYFPRAIRLVILWQGSLRENVIVLIGYLLVGILPCGLLHGNDHMPLFFFVVLCETWREWHTYVACCLQSGG